MKKIFLLFLVFLTSSFAFTEINPHVVIEDLRNGQMQKYKQDNLSTIDTSSLISRGIIVSQDELTRDIPETISKSNIKEHLTCSFVGDDWTATVYDIDAKAGIVTCMVAKKGDLYNPIGVFDTYYPNMQKAFALDLKKAEEENRDLIYSVNNQFKPLRDKVNDIYQSTRYSQNKEYLTIPELLTAAVLTDTDIIDYEATSSTNKLQLKDNFVSKYYDTASNQFIDNREYILTDAENLFSVYTGLSDISMMYLILLVAFFGVWGVANKVATHFTSKIEGKQNHEKVLPYTFGIIAGILLFFPTSFSESITNENGQTVAQYDIMKTQYQEFEKTGYYMFTDWANDAAKIIIDAEINSIIEKVGIGTSDQIVQTAAGFEQYQKLAGFTNTIWDICKDDIYNYNGLFDSDKKHQYSTDPNQPFPTSEKWAYVNSKIKGNTSTLYYSVNDGEIKSNSSYNSNILSKTNTNNPLDNYYPEYSLSACGKNYYNHQTNYEKYRDYEESFKNLNMQGANSADKIPMLEGIIKFQYELYRDWGYLAVLGLPVSKMQTEFIGGLYKTKRSEVLEKLNNEVKKDSMGSHMIMSSIPYLFVPGAGTVFQVISENGGKMGATLGSAAGPIGTILGAIGGTVAGGTLGMWFAYETSKTILALSPIIGIIIIGLLRFVIIIIKIFSFHFASLFMMPIMFARENIQAISRFTMKIFATMLELPIFVLSVWLAITASSLIHTIGDIFGKKIIIGMLENNDLQYEGVENSTWTLGLANGEWLAKLKIYVFDGFIEIAIAAFSIIIIYKIIVTLHSTLFEVMEVQGSREIDNAIESMKNESTGWGSRI
ncbi:hypothetical protein [Halarcobacter bivalviorum]|uniref:hypothetical protein n=1 Tax=Halarcobacter bivalviorum TaxID=663364 RepID=UPI00100BA5F8|nr:hypothetical protein [Halarcobacter bivalviorum]RXK05377.1 hypothetical protein CRU97_08525 [Halarcobacter bivalviorum]